MINTYTGYGFKKPLVLGVVEATLDYGGKLSDYVGAQEAGMYDNYVFHEMDKATKNQYKGGTWDMVELKGGTFFLCLKPDNKRFPLFSPDNFCDEEASTVGACLGANLVALNKAAWRRSAKGDQAMADKLSDMYYSLRDASCDHADASALIRFID